MLCTIETYAFGLPKNHPHQKNLQSSETNIPFQLRKGMGYCEGKAVFSAALRGTKCSQCGVHKGICAYTCRFAKVNGNVLNIWSVYVQSMQKSMQMF